MLLCFPLVFLIFGYLMPRGSRHYAYYDIMILACYLVIELIAMIVDYLVSNLCYEIVETYVLCYE